MAIMAAILLGLCIILISYSHIASAKHGKRCPVKCRWVHRSRRFCGKSRDPTNHLPQIAFYKMPPIHAAVLRSDTGSGRRITFRAPVSSQRPHKTGGLFTGNHNLLPVRQAASVASPTPHLLSRKSAANSGPSSMKIGVGRVCHFTDRMTREMPQSGITFCRPIGAPTRIVYNCIPRLVRPATEFVVYMRNIGSSTSKDLNLS